jgi:RNA polymerase sigma factor (sigma-70 family)
VDRRRFQTTHWSVVLQCQEEDTPAGREALSRLCEAYWYPLYVYIRSQGYAQHDAQDLVQSYFLELFEKNLLQEATPAKGRFRSFLLACLKHFLAHERQRAQAKKRAPEGAVLSLDFEQAEDRYRIEPVDELTPEAVFERRWALTVIERALGRLEGEQRARGREERFRCLGPYLAMGGPQRPYKELADQLGMSEGAIKVAVRRLRLRFGDLLREEIAQTVADPTEIDEEIRTLLARAEACRA